MLNFPLSGRHALIGGASRGIGRATAFALANAGANCTLLGRSAQTLSLVLDQLADHGGYPKAPASSIGQRGYLFSVDLQLVSMVVLFRWVSAPFF